MFFDLGRRWGGKLIWFIWGFCLECYKVFLIVVLLLYWILYCGGLYIWGVDCGLFVVWFFIIFGFLGLWFELNLKIVFVFDIKLEDDEEFVNICNGWLYKSVVDLFLIIFFLLIVDVILIVVFGCWGLLLLRML